MAFLFQATLTKLRRAFVGSALRALSSFGLRLMLMLTKEQFPQAEGASDFTRNLRAAAELLEAIVTDRGLLSRVPAADRRRLLDAAGTVYNLSLIHI